MGDRALIMTRGVLRRSNDRAPPLRWLLTALVIAVAAPMLAACSGRDPDDVPPAVERGTILLPKPGITYCGVILGEYCSDSARLILDTSTGKIFSACRAGQVVSELTGKNENCGRRSKPLQVSNAYYAWLARVKGIRVPGVPDDVLDNTPIPKPLWEQELMTPGVSDPVLTNTPTGTTPLPDNW
jgi:hypothetical protein